MDLLLVLAIAGAVVVALSSHGKLIRYAAILALQGIAFGFTRFDAMAQKVNFVAEMQGQSNQQFTAGVMAMARELEGARPALLIGILALALLACRPLTHPNRPRS
jgi:uncharacterized protein VirK/YbjX